MFITIIISIIIGSVFGFLLYKNIDNNINDLFNNHSKLTFFQTGVFTNEENAIKYAYSFENAIIIKDEDLYRVYISILNNPESISAMRNHFNRKNINYHLRIIYVEGDEFIERLQKYEQIILALEDEGTYNVINERILRMYKESMEHITFINQGNAGI